MPTRFDIVKKPPRRWFAPRFSLRALLLLVTILAVAAAVWWRWPLQQTQQTKVNHRIPGVNTTVYGTETITYHRGWNGSLIRHGKRTLVYNGELYEEEMFQEGVKHGPAHYPHGMPKPDDPNDHRSLDTRSAAGEFFLGKMHGTWEFLPVDWKTSAPGKRCRSIENWNRGKWDGVFEWFDESGKSCFRHEFKDDRLIDPQNNPTGNLLLKRIADGTLKDPATVHTIFQGISPAFARVPLKEVVDDSKDRYGLMLAWPYSGEFFLANGKPEPIYNAHVSVHEINIPLYAGFDKILRPLGLVLDFRFGTLCIVDEREAKVWQDATGVMDLRPSPGSELERHLDAPARVTWFVPLPLAIHNIGSDQGIPTDLHVELPSDADGEINPFTERAGLPVEVMRHRSPGGQTSPPPPEPLPLTLRQVLGLLLDQAHLHCREERGVLIIEPLQNDAATPAEDRMP